MSGIESPSTIKLPEVKNSHESKDILYFTLRNTNISIANAIRRTILADIKTVVINSDEKDIDIEKNTSKFNNEIIKQRLGCIPVHIKDFEGVEHLSIELDIENDNDSLVYITTKNIKIKNKLLNTYLTDKVTTQIFPANKKTKFYILIARLRPKISKYLQGEILKLKANFKIGTAGENGMYNVVHTCAYGYTPDEIEQADKWEEVEKLLTSQKISPQEITKKKQNWYTLDAKRYYIIDSFDFQIGTVGVFTNMEIIHKACNILINKLKNISEKCDAENLELDKISTAMENCVDIKLIGEGYTIGKIIEYILHYDYYLNDHQLSYVGFLKKHPHDTFSIIRIIFKEKDHFTDTNIYAMIKYTCLTGIKIFDTIKEYF